MTVCPIAIVAGCLKCPAFSVCPLKTVLGNAGKADNNTLEQSPAKPSSRRDSRGSQTK